MLGGERVPERKMGRPLSANPKGIKLTVRFDSTTYSDLEKYCKRTNVTKAEALRQGFYRLRDGIQKEE